MSFQVSMGEPESYCRGFCNCTFRLLYLQQSLPIIVRYRESLGVILINYRLDVLVLCELLKDCTCNDIESISLGDLIADRLFELCPYAAHSQKITVKDFYFIKDWKSKAINKETFYVELGIADYTENNELKSWEVLATYEPIEANIYYESHLFRKNILELR